MRREKQLRLKLDEFAWLFTNRVGGATLRYLVLDVPEDAELVRVWQDTDRGYVRVTFAHPSFPALEAGQVPELLWWRGFGVEFEHSRHDHDESILEDHKATEPTLVRVGTTEG